MSIYTPESAEGRRTNLNAKASELDTEAKFWMSKYINFYLIPVWLDETLVGIGQNETVLDDTKKINSILTAEDIKFYNDNVARIYDIKGMLPFPKDMCFSYLTDNRKYPNGIDSSACVNTPTPSLENSISKKEGLAPFVRNFDECVPGDLWNLVARYKIHRLVDRHMVSIRFEVCAQGSWPAEQAKEDQKLAEFYIAEFGVQQFANTELFKKILTV